MLEEEKRTLVIATNSLKDALLTIVKDASQVDYIEIHFTERYAKTVEYLLRLLRKGCGWKEEGRGIKEVGNTRCIFNQRGYCIEQSKRGCGLRCIESIRLNCKLYRKKYRNKMTVNYIEIEKAGGIRGM